MVKKTLTLLDEEFEKFEQEVKFPSNMPGHISQRITDKVKLAKDADFSQGTDEEVVENVENIGEVMAGAQQTIMEFALDHMEAIGSDMTITEDNLSQEAYETVLKQYTDSVQGVKVGKN